MDENAISRIVLDQSIYVHRVLGPGLLESVYEAALSKKLRDCGLTIHCQLPVPVAFEGTVLEIGFRADIIIEQKVIVELKSIEKLQAVHAKQLLTYLRLTGMKLGLLINFGEALLKDGVKRVVNNL